MKKELLKHLSLAFCNNSCGKEKCVDCDTKGITCACLAMFLCDCNKYTEPNISQSNGVMTIEVTKKDLIRLLRGTSVPYELWDKMPKDLGNIQGGGWTDPEWKWNCLDKHFLERTEQELYDLYVTITRY